VVSHHTVNFNPEVDPTIYRKIRKDFGERKLSCKYIIGVSLGKEYRALEIVLTVQERELYSITLITLLFYSSPTKEESSKKQNKKKFFFLSE
jgi:hypothetical protein